MRMARKPNLIVETPQTPVASSLGVMLYGCILSASPGMILLASNEKTQPREGLSIEAASTSHVTSHTGSQRPQSLLLPHSWNGDREGWNTQPEYQIILLV